MQATEFLEQNRAKHHQSTDLNSSGETLFELRFALYKMGFKPVKIL